MRKLLLIAMFFLLTGCKFPKVVSAFYAKEVCSCLFVEKQSEAYCHEYGKQIIPIWTKEIDIKNKKVVAWGLWESTEASFISLRSGCQIVK